MKKFLLIIFLSFCFATNVSAHPGNTDSNGCHKCNAAKTNCSSWGLADYEYHCHNGSTYTNSKGQKFNSNGTQIIESNNNKNDNTMTDNTNENNNSNNNNNNNIPIDNLNENSNLTNNNSNNSNTNDKNEIVPPKQDKEKSNDNTLKSLIIDNQEVTIADNMEYNTLNSEITIKVETNDSNATYEIKNNSSLSIGENKINIEVTAEDGSTKTYNLIVNREKELSSDTGIEVFINGEKVSFDNQKNASISTTDTSIDFNYKLNDSNAVANVEKFEELKDGDNYINIKVTAEDGTEKNYKITIHKTSKTEDTIYTIIGLAIICGMGYGIYRLFKKIIKIITKKA